MKTVVVIIMMFVVNISFGQINLTNGSVVAIDFTGFSGAGFTPSPGAGQLDSDDWAIAGLSEGDLDFGGAETSGDFARGESNGKTGTGGIYSFNTGINGPSLGFQATGADMNPGHITLRIQNNTGGALTQLNIQYEIFNYNDQNRASSLNFAYSSDNSNYSDISALDFTSIETANGNPAWSSVLRNTSIEGLSIANGDFVYLRWITADVSGGGYRDEFSIDNILLSANDTNLPVELTSFTAKAGDRRVILNWSTASEVDNQGFEVLRSDEKTGRYALLSSYETNSKLEGAGNSSHAVTYTFTDNSVFNNSMYWYKIVDVDVNGIRTEHGPVYAMPHRDKPIIDPVIGELPNNFTLYANYPNPFNPNTTIRFDIPDLKEGMINVKLNVYDITGKKIITLLDGAATPGPYEVKWNGKNKAGYKMPSGIYIYQFISAKYQASRKMLLTK
jgi:hypothetical protein